MLKNRTMKEHSIEIAEEMKKSVQMNDDLRQLFTSLESSFSQHLNSQIISLRFELTEDDRISRFHSKDAEDAAESSNVIVRRKSKRKKLQTFEFDQLFAIDQTSLNVTKIQIDLKNQSRRDIESVDLNEANILSNDQKRTRKLISRYAQIV
jgi:cytidylate kinase